MRDRVLLGIERRRPWTDQAKLAILGKAGANGSTEADVARRHDMTRQPTCAWGEMRRKGLSPVIDTPVFLPVEIAVASQAMVGTAPGGMAGEIKVVLRNGRQLRCPDGIEDAALVRLVRLLETA